MMFLNVLDAPCYRDSCANCASLCPSESLSRLEVLSVSVQCECHGLWPPTSDKSAVLQCALRMLRWIAVCCSALQSVAERRSVWQCVEVRLSLIPPQSAVSASQKSTMFQCVLQCDGVRSSAIGPQHRRGISAESTQGFAPTPIPSRLSSAPAPLPLKLECCCLCVFCFVVFVSTQSVAVWVGSLVHFAFFAIDFVSSSAHCVDLGNKSFGSVC